MCQGIYRPLVGGGGGGGFRESISPWWGMTGGVSGNLYALGGGVSGNL